MLLVDDNFRARATLRRLVARSDLGRDWQLFEEASPSAALMRALSETFDLIATDLRFRADEMTGLDLVRAVRAIKLDPPILLFTAWPWTAAERAEILIAGADDVMGVPLDGPLEFVARAHGLLRRSSRTQPAVGRITIGNLHVDVAARRVHVDQALITLTRDQLTIVIVVASAWPNAVSFNDLAAALGYTSVYDRRAIIEAVRRLRTRLGDASVAIESVKGFGFCFSRGCETGVA